MSKPLIIFKFCCFWLIGGFLFFQSNNFINYRLVDCGNFQDGGFFRPFGELGNPKIRANAVIFGSSKARHGINPKFLSGLGLEFYNFSINSATVEYYYYWFYPLFKKYYPKPELILLEVNSMIFGKGLSRTSIQSDIVFFPSNIFFTELLNPNFNINIFTMIKYINKSNFANCLFAKRVHHDKNGPTHAYRDIYRGFYPYYINGWKHTRPKPIDFNDNGFEDRKIVIFELLVNEFLENGSKVILINTPEYTKARKPNDKAFKTLRDFSKKKNIRFLDYNEGYSSDINNNDTLFSDPLHLNRFGHAKFSLKLKKDLTPIIEKFFPQEPKT